MLPTNEARPDRPRQTLLALGEEFLSAIESKSRSRRNGRAATESKTELESLLAVLRQIDDRLAELDSRLCELANAVAIRPAEKEYYTTQEAAKILGKRPYTVREWCRLARVRAEKALSGRGIDEEWRISHEELMRIHNEGLLPMKNDGLISPARHLPR